MRVLVADALGIATSSGDLDRARRKPRWRRAQFASPIRPSEAASPCGALGSTIHACA
jgi:hypothetical protein